MVRTREEKTPPLNRLSYDLSGFGGIDAYTTQNQLSPKICCYGYNIQLRGGLLGHCIGVGAPTYMVGEEEVTIPSLVPLEDSVKKMHYFRGVGDASNGNKIIAVGDSGKFYVCDLLSPSEFQPLVGAPQVEGEVTFVNYYKEGVDTLYAYTSRGLTTFDGANLLNYEEVPPFTDLTMLYERAFGIVPSRDSIYFSAPLDPTNFSVESGGGEIVLRDDGGKMLRICSHAGSIFIIKEYGIYKLSVLGSPTDYTLSKIVCTTSKIQGSSVALSPEGIILLVGSTLKIFDGYYIKEVDRGLSALIESSEHARGVYFDETYFLSCLLKTEGEVVGDERDLGIRCNNGVLVFNFNSGARGIMRGADIVGFYPILTTSIREIFVVYGNARSHRVGKLTADGRLYGEPLEKLWRSASTDLRDVERYKVLKRMVIDTKHDLDIKVTQGGKSVTRRAYGYSNQPATIPFNSAGYDFSFELRANDELFVRGVKLIFDFVRRYFP